MTNNIEQQAVPVAQEQERARRILRDTISKQTLRPEGFYDDGRSMSLTSLVAVEAMMAFSGPSLPCKSGEGAGEHPDDRAVDLFAARMKTKLAMAREKGRGGWDDPAQCSVAYLQQLLGNHVVKGDPVDVANFCMMLDHYGASTLPDATQTREAELVAALREIAESGPFANPHAAKHVRIARAALNARDAA